MKKAEKVLFVDNLTAELSSKKNFVLINYTGLTVKSQQELKKRLKEVGAKMLVVKNTLLKRASETAKLDKEILTDEILSGQTALVISEGDPISFIQVIGKFTKEFSVPQMKVGIIDGLFQNSLFLSQISILPSKDILLSQLLGVLSGNLQKLVYVLSQRAG